MSTKQKTEYHLIYINQNASKALNTKTIHELKPSN